MNPHDHPRPDRRTAIKWMLTAAASVTLLDRGGLVAAPAAPGAVVSAAAAAPVVKGYGTDPVLNREYKPGDFWPLTFSDAQRRTAAALCAAIIPADDNAPSAASLGVHDFIDEWISSPYPDQHGDRVVVLEGLAWIDAESTRRFGKSLADLDPHQMASLCDDLCHVPDAKPEHVAGAKFFARFRDLTAGGFYTTPQGMKEAGYTGNLPLAEFKGPPLEVLQKLGLA